MVYSLRKIILNSGELYNINIKFNFNNRKLIFVNYLSIMHMKKTIKEIILESELKSVCNFLKVLRYF